MRGIGADESEITSRTTVIFESSKATNVSPWRSTKCTCKIKWITTNQKCFSCRII